jgi:fibronectin-binding autotransporter adhesin
MHRSDWTVFHGALQVAALVTLSAPTTPLRADTTFNSGETTVSTETDFGSTLTVASTGTATLKLVDGAYATNESGYVGSAAGSFGTVTVSGGTWATSNDLSVGYDGGGRLEVKGGLVTNANANVGSNAGGTGLALVQSGTWATSDFLVVGKSGTGQLFVTGGLATSRVGVLGYDAGGLGTATVSFGTWDNSEFLSVGYIGEGTLNVTGGRVTTQNAYLGDGSGVGTAAVSSGTWEMNASLFVGYFGTGSLSMTGGRVTNTNASIGTYAGSIGTATVSGGTWAISGDLAVGSSGTGTLTMTGGLVSVAGTLSKGANGTIDLNPGGTLQIGAGGTTGVLLGGTGGLTNNGTLIFNRFDASTYSGVISGTGTIQNDGTGTTTLTGQTSFTSGLGATAGRLIVGSTASVNGFSTTGSLAAASGATLELKSKGLAYVNGLSTLTGGTIVAANGISLGAGANVLGAGLISGRVAAAAGSRVEASGGRLTLGDAASYSGIYSVGELYTNANEVELLDRNLAVLGSLTQLGDGSAGGTLRAANGMLLEQGRNLVGRGTVYGNFVNQGDVYGDGSAAGQKIVFAAGSTVSGIGSFENVVFGGTYSPGNSPAITSLTNGEFSSASSLLIELGGTQPGTEYDRVVDSGVLALLGGTLNVVLCNGSVPSFGDSFEILQYGQLSGDFGTVNYPALSGGLS